MFKLVMKISKSLIIIILILILFIFGLFLVRTKQNKTLSETKDTAKTTKEIEESSNGINKNSEIIENNFESTEDKEIGLDNIKFSYPDNWSMQKTETFRHKAVHLYSDENINSSAIKEKGYFCLEFTEYKAGSSWINNYNFEIKDEIPVSTEIGDFVMRHYNKSGNSVFDAGIAGLLPLGENEIHITATFNCSQADNDFLEDKTRLFKNTKEYQEAIKILESLSF